jgi:hypothetical protein
LLPPRRRGVGGPPLAANIIAKCYDGGHMMYEEPAIRRQVTSDIAAFYLRSSK